MSDDFDLDLDFGEVDLSQAKEWALPAQDKYEFVVDEYELRPGKTEDSKKKGFGIQVVLKFDDPHSVRTELGEDADFTNAKFYKYIWVSKDNPINGKKFIDAITGQDNRERLSFNRASDFIGERVGAYLVHGKDFKNPLKIRAEIVDDSWFAV